MKNKSWKKTFKKGSKAYQFLELANPNEDGISRVVEVSEFTGSYSNLKFGNGADWARRSSLFQRVFKVEFIKANSPGFPTIAIKLNGYKEKLSSNVQTIHPKIKKELAKKRCIILGTTRSCDHKTEVDHKDGRKDNPRVMNPKTQRIEDFQPLSKPANDAKRQFCKVCAKTNQRFDAKRLGYTTSFIQGDVEYTEELGCIGCYWYDPIAFRQAFVLKKE
ncbi:restriction endonuclease [Salegentibacter chungangensis]|uniref:Restriction endonuclease n=1 Tax=Salegentibacter chungangensis TaxID=1335724 RepID=A0ABW3NPZ0_9FLAO